MNPEISRRLGRAMYYAPLSKDMWKKFTALAGQADSFDALDAQVRLYILATERKQKKLSLKYSVVKNVSLKYSPDQDRDEFGRFTSGGGSSMSPSEAADKVYARAEAIEPAVTAMMQDVASRNGATMSGLQFKLKGKDSLERKIADRASKRLDKSAEKAAETISDSVRYTMVAEAGNYADMATNAVAEFEAQGYECNVKNYWEEGNQYKGINVAMTSPEGDQIELQFHTPESLAVKMEQNHPLYEQARKLEEDSPEFKMLDAQMTLNSAALVHPPNVENVGKPL